MLSSHVHVFKQETEPISEAFLRGGSVQHTSFRVYEPVKRTMDTVLRTLSQ